MMLNLFYYYSIAICFAHLLLVTNHVSAFSPASSIKVSGISQIKLQQHDNANKNNMILATRLSASPSGDNTDNNLGVIDLTDEDEDDIPLTNDYSKQQQQQQIPAPFLSQGELSDDPNLLSPDFNDAKQSRVIFYIILTLVPIVSYKFDYCIACF